MKKRLLSFEEFAKDAQPEALFTLVHSIVDRIYITTDGTKQKCQVYIKGCATENYSDILGAAGYIEEEPLLPVVSYMPPMCDLDYYSIGTEVPQTDNLWENKSRHRQILRKLCEHKEIEIIEANACPDHIHMPVSIPPKYSVSQIMGYLKGKAA